MSNKSLLFVLILGILSINACKQAETAEAMDTTPTEAPVEIDLAKIKADVQNFENQWAAALNAKDVNALMALYGDNAITMPDDAEMIVGKEAIRINQEKEIADRKGSYSFETLEVFAQGSLVTEIGKTFVKDASGTNLFVGKYMTVLQKAGNSYVCIREIYNADSKMK